MHEARLIADAVEAALRDAPSGVPGALSRPRELRLTILNPVHVSADAARLYAEIVLRAQDLADVPIAVESVEVACAGCGAANHPEPQHPFCGDCGWPLPRYPGPEVEVRAAW
jgi:Zn finger protein HypA/HybF involved in hydrogenase expression